MDNTRNRSRNIKIPFNIWSGDQSRVLRDSETICEDCGGCGGYDYTKNGTGLIKQCNPCEGRGYFDWIHNATKQGDPEYSFFIAHTGDQISAAVKNDQAENYIKRITVKMAGQYKFKTK